LTIKSIYLLAIAMPIVAVGCMDQGISPLAPTERLCTSDSSVCWTQTIGDPRNTPENDPRCVQTLTDSTLTQICEYGDTIEVSIAWRQYYKDIHPEFPHNGGGKVITIVKGDTLSKRTW
jgi:hypothetical protein